MGMETKPRPVHGLHAWSRRFNLVWGTFMVAWGILIPLTTVLTVVSLGVGSLLVVAAFLMPGPLYWRHVIGEQRKAEELAAAPGEGE